jgi:hypothetical protein
LINPIDKDKVAENPGLLPYSHSVGGVVVRPEDEGKLKSRALSAMREQTNRQLSQLQKQAELIASQANELKRRVEVSEKIYQAHLSFEPFIGHIYHLYESENKYKLMLIAPNEWGKTKRNNMEYINSVKLLSDHTWEIVDMDAEF